MAGADGLSFPEFLHEKVLHAIHFANDVSRVVERASRMLAKGSKHAALRWYGLGLHGIHPAREHWALRPDD
jgi:hypothetical protein